jgi:hypothetical protein
MLQAGRSRVRFPIRWISFFNLPNPTSRTMVLGSTQPLEMSTRNIPGGVKGSRCVRLTTSPLSVSRVSRENTGTSRCHKPMCLHGLLQGWLYLFFLIYPSTATQPFVGLRPFFSFLILQTVGRTPWMGISPSKGHFLHTQDNTNTE